MTDDHRADQARAHDHGSGHAHPHLVIDPALASSSRGLQAVTWSFVGLTLTALVQFLVVALSGSVALLADTIHNVGDAATAIPLGLAFWLARRRPSERFTYGLGRIEDLAGLAIVATILASGILVAWESVARLLHPRPIQMLWAVTLASVIGFLGNEAVAVFRIRVGRQIGSAALVADGYHARADGWTSLAVLVGAMGVWAGFPVADPLIGLVISLAIFWVAWQSGRSIVMRMLDGLDAGIVEAIDQAARHAPRVAEVTDIRARWVGHRLHAELSVTVPGGLSVEDGHAIANEVRHRLFHHLPHLGSAIVHVDPSGQGGERHHGIAEHAHDGLPDHSHP
jgi:cation diffusion facilitator family transporter